MADFNENGYGGYGGSGSYPGLGGFYGTLTYVEGQTPITGEGVLRIQKDLNLVHKYHHGNWAQLTENSTYDKQMAEAVKQFQIAKNLTGRVRPGVYDILTHFALKEEADTCRKVEYNLQFQIDMMRAQEERNKPSIGPAPSYNSQTAFPVSYTFATQDSFGNTYGGTFSSIWSDVFSMLSALFTNRAGFNGAVNIIKESGTTIYNHFRVVGDMINRDFSHFKQTRFETIKELFHFLENCANEKITKHVAEAKTAQEAFEAGNPVKGKAFSVIQWGPTLALLFWQCCRYMMATTPQEKKDAGDGVAAAFDGLMGAVMSVLIEKVVTIIVTRVVVGAAAGSVVPGAGNVVGVIIGFILAVIDIVVVLITGKSMGEWVWEGLKTVAEWMDLGEKARVALCTVSHGAKAFYDGLVETPQGTRAFNHLP